MVIVLAAAAVAAAMGMFFTSWCFMDQRI